MKRIFSVIVMAALLIGMMPLGALQVNAVQSFEISDECLDMIKEFEGFSAKPYWDYGQWTVGYGTRAPSEHLERYKKEGISREEATELLRDKLNEYGQDVLDFAEKFNLELTQGQFDALLSLSFNCGPNWMWSTSTFRSAVIEGRTGNDFLFAMGQWSTAGGEVQRGLVRRRLIEINMYLNGVYSMDVPENYTYVLYDANGGERDVKVQCYDSGVTAKPISVPTYEGYTFLGWYTKAEGGDRIEVLDASVSGYKLYAHWGTGAEEENPGTEEQEPVQTVVDYQREVVGQSVSVLEQPRKGADVLSVCKAGSIVHIIKECTDADGTKWGMIENSGWIDLSETKEFSWEDAEKNGVKVTVTANDVNIRKGPGTGYSRTGSVHTGEQLVIVSTATGSGYTWGQFSGGWICLKYTNYDAIVNTKPDEDAGESGVQEPEMLAGTVTSEEGLRVRSQPGTGYAVVGYLSNGEKVQILERRSVDGRYWGRMEKGWICLDYVRLEDSQTPEEPEEPTVEAKNGSVTGSNLRIRSGPGTAYTVLGYLQKGDRVVITETRTTGTTLWGKCEQGWISMDYVLLEEQEVPPVEEPEKPKALSGTVTGDHLRIRSGAGTGYEIVGYLNAGDRVQITEQVQVGSTLWGKCEQGWISMDYVRLDETENSQSVTGVVSEGNLLRVRSGAGSNYTVVAYLNPGTKVVILEQKTVDGTKWGRVEEGWINLAFVTLDGSEEEEPEDGKITGVITADMLNVRSEPGTGSRVVGYYYYGDTVTVLETADVNGMSWGRTEKGWICMDYVQ